jgi:uncharacterized peroxidase-related enzyme
MQTIQPIETHEADGITLRLFETAQRRFGTVSNMMRTMGQSPRALGCYLHMRQMLSDAAIPEKVCTQIALAVSEANQSRYCLHRHTAEAERMGLDREEIAVNRDARAADPRTRAALRFAEDLVTRTGRVNIHDLRSNGFDDSEIVDLIAVIALTVFENYFNLAAQTELDHRRTWKSANAA